MESFKSNADMVNYNSIADNFQSGDLILFHGPGPESELIEVIDHTPFSHVAMVIRLDGYTKPLLWTSDEITTISDVLDGKKEKGVHLLDLGAVLKFCSTKTSRTGAHYKYCWRKLEYQKPADFMEKFEQFMHQVDGTAFPSLEAMALHFFAGKLGISTGTKTMFCSELATDTLVHLDLLPSDTIINSYSPGSYAAGQGLQLLHGARYGDEVDFSYVETTE